MVFQRVSVHGGSPACLRRLAAAFLVFGLLSQAGASAEPPPKLAVLPFEIQDTSGEVGEPSRHEAMLANLTQFIARRVSASGIFSVADEVRVNDAVVTADSGTYLRSCNGCELDIAKSVGADAVMIGWVYKVSTLVGTLHVVIKDVPTGKTIYAHVFDFRGDNEKAWHRAADYMVRGLDRRITRGPQTTN